MRILLGLFVAAGLSLLIGLTASHIASLMPCQGEGLACNLNEAIGGYAVFIWTCLGPLIFGVILLVANNRVALFGGMALARAASALHVRKFSRGLDHDRLRALPEFADGAHHVRATAARGRQAVADLEHRVRAAPHRVEFRLRAACGYAAG